MHTSIYWSI